MHPLLLIPCVALYGSVNRPAPALPSWPELREIVLQLTSVEGTSQLFQSNPRLGASYASERAFMDLVAKWRSALRPLPATYEALNPDLATVRVKTTNDSDAVFLTFHSQEVKGRLTFVKLVWEDRKLVKVEFYRGFQRGIPTGVEESREEFYLDPQERIR